MPKTTQPAPVEPQQEQTASVADLASEALYRAEAEKELDEEEEDHITGTIRGQPGNKTILSTSIETVPGEIAAKARRNLRRDVESKLGESSRRFLAAFSEVDKVHYSDRCLNSKC